MPAGTFDRDDLSAPGEEPAAFWKPLVLTPEHLSQGRHWLAVAGRLRAGVSLAQCILSETCLVLGAILVAQRAVIDDHDPDRNPARCMRQLRRLFDNISLRAAIRRLAAEMPDPPPRNQ